MINDTGSDALAIRTFGLCIIVYYVTYLKESERSFPLSTEFNVESAATIASFYANALKQEDV